MRQANPLTPLNLISDQALKPVLKDQVIVSMVSRNRVFPLLQIELVNSAKAMVEIE